MKKLTTFLLTLSLLFTSSLLHADTSATEPVMLDGKYQISNLAELRWLTDEGDTDRVQRWSSDYLITADIDAADTSTWNGGLGFLPIGNNTVKFTGTFTNPNGYRIQNLYINRNPAVNDYVGLFGNVVYPGRLDSIILENVNITGTYGVGGLLGKGIDGAIIESCSVSGQVNGISVVGGLVGELARDSIINNSYSSASISTSTQSHAGGLAGRVS